MSTLPVIFMALMGLSLLIYVVLDGYDLGVGMLSATAREADRDRIVAAIGPFWDANETWLVLAVGLLLIAYLGVLVHLALKAAKDGDTSPLPGVMKTAMSQPAAGE